MNGTSFKTVADVARLQRPSHKVGILANSAARTAFHFLLMLVAAFLASRNAFAEDNPGNVFVIGEEVQIRVPTGWAGWRAIDVDGKEIAAESAGAGVVALGKLPVGYFELLEKDGPGKATAAVLNKVTPTPDTPIAIDAAMSWFYSDPDQIRAACRLCQLAGVNWVRDRLSWPELESARGTWATESRYERAMRIQHDAGLKILQVNHASPAWATTNQSHFPDHLRDVYAFYRGLAKRWNGLVDAIEPWNEPDLDLFGGHTGCEIASFQKAAYLGLKAGDPQLPVCEAVFAIDRAETLDEFGANSAYPYFDIYNLHHYIGLPAYSRAYGRHRAVTGGRPMWTTEFNLTINWADEATKEPSHEDLRIQGYRVGKVFSGALYEGSEKAFYFILGDYVERNLQYGLVHKDLTPRPAYVAFAAVGRLLNGAKPIGRVDLGDEQLKGYVFATVVDGTQKETVVAWSETNPTTIALPTAETSYDYLGRELPQKNSAELTRATTYFVLPPGGSKELKITPPPAKAERLDGKPCPVVLQIVGKGDSKQSAFVLEPTKQLRLVAYNFGDTPAHGRLQLEGATGAPTEVNLPAGDRQEWTITVSAADPVVARLKLADAQSAVVSARTTLTPTVEQKPQ
jgi:hypothetical protein